MFISLDEERQSDTGESVLISDGIDTAGDDSTNYQLQFVLTQTLDPASTVAIMKAEPKTRSTPVTVDFALEKLSPSDPHKKRRQL